MARDHDDYDESYKVAEKKLRKKQRPDISEELREEIKHARRLDAEHEKELKRKEPAAFYAALLSEIQRAKKGGSQRLNLSGGGEEEYQLTDLPESLYQLGRLRSLDLSSNQLRRLPDEFSRLSQLESIDLSNNKLTSFLDYLTHLSLER